MLTELVVPHFFGDYFTSHLRQLVWMVALNSQREPFYYSMYVGVPIALAAGVAAFSGRRHTVFWTIVLAGCLLGSFGPYTPVYPALETLVPPLRSFRFPVKYLSLGSFGLAVLAGFAIQWLIDRDVPRRPLTWVLAGACTLSVITYAFVAWLLTAPAIPLHLAYRLAIRMHVPFPLQGAEYLIFRARPLLTTLFLKLACSAFLLWIAASQRRERRTALIVFAAFAVGDLVLANSGVNPTLPAGWVAKPEWTAQLDPGSHGRVYIGGRLFGEIDSRDIDAPKYSTGFEERSRPRAALQHREGARLPYVRVADSRAGVVRSASALADRVRADADAVPAGESRGAAQARDAKRRAVRRPAHAAV